MSLVTHQFGRSSIHFLTAVMAGIHSWRLTRAWAFISNTVSSDNNNTI